MAWAVELAQDCGRHHGVGIDLVAMCANDVITCGAEPLFSSTTSPPASSARPPWPSGGIASGGQSGCSLLGGETAEMPGFYPAGRYDLAGFCVAVVDEPRLIDGQSIQPGDQLLAIASSGVHSNGFSLVRRILEANQIPLEASQAALNGCSAAEALLQPTLLYAPLVKALLQSQDLELRGMAHITGGGLPENLPRALPQGLAAQIDPTSWERPALFRWLQELGSVPERDLWHTFNLGIGYVLVVPPNNSQQALEVVQASGFTGWICGEIVAGAGVLGLPAGA